MSPLPSPYEIKSLLVEDEAVAIHRLRQALLAYPAIKIIGEARDGLEAVSLINSVKPDLVFLDIQMPGFTGFEVLEKIEHYPAIVFVTAYEEYAVKAFEKNSLDYLLKPVEAARLAITIERVLQHIPPSQDSLMRIKQLASSAGIAQTISTIPVKTGNKIILVPIAEVCFFEAKDKYVYVHTGASEMLVDYSLTYLQERLPAEFIRVHRGYIINKLKVKEIHKYFKGTFVIRMLDGKTTGIKSAYSYYDDIRAKLLLP